MNDSYSNNPNNYNENSTEENIKMNSLLESNNRIKVQSPTQRPESQNFNVLVRIRPIIPQDTEEIKTEEELKPCIFKKSSNRLILANEKSDKNYEMSFDHVMGQDSSQKNVYHSFGDKLLNDIFKGYNGTIMAYGQTGSGKSYTIFGKSKSECESREAYESAEGIVQRSIKDIFQFKKMNKGKKTVNVYLSFIQVYLNQIIDLLNDKNTKPIFNSNTEKIKDENGEDRIVTKFKFGKESKNLSIGNSLALIHDKNGVYIKDLTVKTIETGEELLNLIKERINFRVNKSTSMNKQSSRSHAILQITLEQKWKEEKKNKMTNEITSNIHHLKSMLTIVDLAGSENISRTGSEGIKQDEAKEINKSISALGRVIEALSKNSKSVHVSYRDSKLTEILSDCLGGNSKTVIIACVSPLTANCDEIYNTLQFASRAMIIKTQPKKNERIIPKKNNNKNDLNCSDDMIQNDLNDDGPLRNNDNNNIIISNNKRKFDYNIPTNRSKNKGNENTKRNKSTEDYISRKNNYIDDEGCIGSKEDFKNITKKFYSMILHLQEELGKLTVKNYELEEENNYLRDQLRNYN